MKDKQMIRVDPIFIKKVPILSPQLIANVLLVHIVADVIEGVAVDTHQHYIKRMAASIRTMADVYGDDFVTVAENAKLRILRLNCQRMHMLTALAYVLRKTTRKAAAKYHKLDSSRQYEQTLVADKIYNTAIALSQVHKRTLADITSITADIESELIISFKERF